MITTAILSALAPAVVEGFKNIFKAASDRWVGLSVDDRLRIQDADLKRLEVIAKLDQPGGTPSQWVIDLRASFRYIACGVFIIGGLATTVVAPAFAPIGIEAAVSASSFIFGERMMLNLKKTNNT